MIELPTGLRETDNRHYVIDAQGIVICEARADHAEEIARALNQHSATVSALAALLAMHDHATGTPGAHSYTEAEKQGILRAAHLLSHKSEEGSQGAEEDAETLEFERWHGSPRNHFVFPDIPQPSGPVLNCKSRAEADRVAKWLEDSGVGFTSGAFNTGAFQLHK